MAALSHACKQRIPNKSSGSKNVQNVIQEIRRLLFLVTRASLSFPGTKRRNPGKEAQDFMPVEEVNPAMQNSFKRALVHAKLSVVPVFFGHV